MARAGGTAGGPVIVPEPGTAGPAVRTTLHGAREDAPVPRADVEGRGRLEPARGTPAPRRPRTPAPSWRGRPRRRGGQLERRERRGEEPRVGRLRAAGVVHRRQRLVEALGARVLGEARVHRASARPARSRPRPAGSRRVLRTTNGVGRQAGAAAELRDDDLVVHRVHGLGARHRAEQPGDRAVSLAIGAVRAREVLQRARCAPVRGRSPARRWSRRPPRPWAPARACRARWRPASGCIVQGALHR